MSRRFKTGTVAKLAGIAPPLLRMWETRYDLVKPARGPGGQRLYSDADVEVIRAVTVLVSRGYAIGEVASWSRSEILEAGRDGVPTRSRAAPADPVILAVDQEGVISAVSPSVEALLGWPHLMLVGQPLWGLLADVPEALERLITGDIAPSGSTVCWVWLRTRARDTIPCRLACGQRRNSGTDSTSLTITITPLYAGDEIPLSSLLQNISASAIAHPHESPEQLFKDYVTTAVERLDAALARVWTYNAKAGTLHLVASSGISKSVATSARSVIKLSSYKFKVGVVARTCVPYLHNGLDTDRDFDRAWIKRERLESAAVLPLIRNGELFGVTAHFFRRRLDAPDVGRIQSTMSVYESSLRDLGERRHRRA